MCVCVCVCVSVCRSVVLFSPSDIVHHVVGVVSMADPEKMLLEMIEVCVCVCLLVRLDACRLGGGFMCLYV